MKNSTKTIKHTNQAFKTLAEGSPLGTIAELIQQSKNDFENLVASIWEAAASLFQPIQCQWIKLF